MALDFANVVKGQITQAVVGALFERWGFRVARLGIEELFGEIKHIDLDQYRRLNLPIQLRTLPDLVVTSVDMTQAFLVEVKFRRQLDEGAAPRPPCPTNGAAKTLAGVVRHSDHRRVLREGRPVSPGLHKGDPARPDRQADRSTFAD